MDIRIYSSILEHRLFEYERGRLYGEISGSIIAYKDDKEVANCYITDGIVNDIHSLNRRELYREGKKKEYCSMYFYPFCASDDLDVKERAYKMILQKIISLYKGKKILAVVDTNDVIALSVYMRMGFKIIGEHIEMSTITMKELYLNN